MDKKSPGISITTPADGGQHKLGDATTADYACAEGGSGMDSCAGSVASGTKVDTASVGQKTLSVEAMDKVGNTTSKSHVYSVVYVFSGFSGLVDNLPTLNSVSAGRAVPVKFSLSGNQGLNIFAEGYPSSQRISCDTSAPLDDIEQTVNAASSSLSYDASTDQYSYVWKTEKSWAGYLPAAHPQA